MGESTTDYLCTETSVTSNGRSALVAAPAGNTVTRPTFARRLLGSGESMVASAGLGAAAILLGAIGGSAWWALQTHEQTLRNARDSQVRTVGELLARNSETMLADRDTTRTSRTLEATLQDYGLSDARITLPNGTVVADGLPGQTEAGLPGEAWQTAGPASVFPGEIDTAVAPDGSRTIRIGMLIPKLGPAVLEIRDTAEPPMWAAWRLQAGIGGFGALGLIGLLLAYRHMRARLRAVGAIRDALAAVDAGQDAGSQLAVSGALGKEAAAWNRLLAERERLREKAATERAAESLSNRRSRDGDLASACDAMWQGMLLVDEQMRVKYVNGAAAVFLRKKREELPGQDATGLFEDSKLAAAVRSVATGAVRSRTVIEVDRTAEKNGGVLRFSVRPVRKEDAATALVLIEDITQQRVADASRNAFVAQATHELRTPLTNIRLYVDGLLEEPDLEPAKRAQSINVISQEARRLERIVGDMLSVAEIEAGQLKLRRGDVRLDALFTELKADFQEQAEHKEIKLVFELPPKLSVIGGDRDKIVLALHNLIGNAIKYTPAGGEVTVRVREEGANLIVDVADNGIGIKSEECELIFDKFYRAKDKRIAGITGSGLGLALAREVARLHGGDITVHSQVDKGSTFTLHLPAAPPPSPVRAAA